MSVFGTVELGCSGSGSMVFTSSFMPIFILVYRAHSINRILKGVSNANKQEVSTFPRQCCIGQECTSDTIVTPHDDLSRLKDL